MVNQYFPGAVCCWLIFAFCSFRVTGGDARQKAGGKELVPLAPPPAPPPQATIPPWAGGVGEQWCVLVMDSKGLFRDTGKGVLGGHIMPHTLIVSTPFFVIEGCFP